MIHVIPAIDIMDGKCVRLTQGDFAQTKEYRGQPVDVAKAYQDAGLKRLHVVDLDGARQKRVVNYKTLERIASQTRLHIDFGGGIQSDQDLRIAFDCGAAQVTGGSVAVKQPDLFETWLKTYGPDRIILGADAKNEKIAVSGWTETSTLWVYDFLEKYAEKGVRYTISTDVAKDGLLQGPSFDLYRQIQDRVPTLHVIASGGVSNLDDIYKLDEMKLYGVIVGKAIYEGRVLLEDLQKFA